MPARRSSYIEMRRHRCSDSSRTRYARVPQTVVARASVPAPVTCATRVEDANTSSATRSPAEALRVSFNDPSSGVATAYVRVLEARVTAPACVVVVLPPQGAVTSCSAAANAAADGKLRKVSVKVKRGKYTVRARPGYVAPSR